MPDILAAVSRNLTVYRVMASIVGVLLVVLCLIGVPLANFDGFPYEVTPVAYTEADAQGGFTIDVDVTGLPLSGSDNQVIAFDSSHRPVAAITFTVP